MTAVETAFNVVRASLRVVDVVRQMRFVAGVSPRLKAWRLARFVDVTETIPVGRFCHRRVQRLPCGSVAAARGFDEHQVEQPARANFS